MTGRRWIAALCCSALLCGGACAGWNEAQDAHNATLAAVREAAETQHAIQACLDRYPAGSSDLELALCIADVASQVQTTADAVQCQVDAVDALIDAVEGDGGAGGGG